MIEKLLLKVDGVLGAQAALLIQKIIDVMPMYRLKAAHAVKHPDSMRFVLEKKGTVLDDGAPLVFRFDRNRRDVNAQAPWRFRPQEVIIHDIESYYGNPLAYDSQISELLTVSPISVRLSIRDAEYEALQRYDVYNPSGPGIREDYGHLVLLTGFGMDVHGYRFLEAQDSQGVNKGAGGYIRIGRESRAITAVFQMLL